MGDSLSLSDATHFFKDCVYTKADLDNYNGFINIRENIHNIQSILGFITQDNKATCNVFPIIFYEFAQAWYHSLKLDFIIDFHDLYVKLISYFSTNI